MEIKEYKIRPGIVLASVCGENILVATRTARDYCPYIRQINSTAAYFWSLLEQGMDMETMEKTAASRYKVEREKIRPGLYQFLNSLVTYGYLYREERV